MREVDKACAILSQIADKFSNAIEREEFSDLSPNKQYCLTVAGKLLKQIALLIILYFNLSKSDALNKLIQVHNFLLEVANDLFDSGK